MPCIAWEIGLDDDFVPRPIMGLHEIALVPDDYKVECHGVELAYNVPEEVLESIGPCVLDYDGKQFIFVPEDSA